MTNNYIEFRIYLHDGIDHTEALEVAEELKDALTDTLADEFAPEVFTQDVTYEVKVNNE